MTRLFPISRAALLLCLVLAACSTQRASNEAPEAEPSKTLVAAAADSLPARLDEILHRRDDGNVRYAARVVDLETGRELYAVAADEPFLPASNMKLPVSAAALDRFGSAHTFKTYLALDGDDLLVVGTGDPGTGDPTIAKKHGGTPVTMFDQWADALLAKGVSTIRGDLVYDDRALDEQRVHPSWSKGFLTDWYAAPVAGLNFNDNCVDITARPTADGEKVAYTVMPPTQGVAVINHLTSGPGDEPKIDRAESADAFSISGATTKPVELKSKPVTDPGAFFADALRTHLASRGITIQGGTRRVDASAPLAVPPVDTIVAVHETRMPDAIGRVNKQSQNLFAEAFCKMLGRAYRADQGRDEPGSWAAGAEAVKSFLARNGIDASSLVVADGSGLGRDNRITTRIISDLLVLMRRHRGADTFFDSLSIAGGDGTLGKRLSDLKGHVFGKTGYIGGVRACSGYVKTRRGKWLVFSFIYNHIDGPVKPYEELQDEAIRALVAYP